MDIGERKRLKMVVKKEKKERKKERKKEGKISEEKIKGRKKERVA